MFTVGYFAQLRQKNYTLVAVLAIDRDQVYVSEPGVGEYWINQAELVPVESHPFEDLFT